jgi:hypothetical protein
MAKKKAKAKLAKTKRVARLITHTVNVDSPCVVTFKIRSRAQPEITFIRDNPLGQLETKPNDSTAV